MTLKLVLQWLSCQKPGALGFLLGLVGLVLVYCNNNNNNSNNQVERCNSRFCTVSSLHGEPSPTRTLWWPEHSHVQHINRLSHATCHVVCHVVQKDSSAIKFDRVYIVFIVLTESLTDEEGVETGKTRENPGDELQKMPHTEPGRLKPQVRLKLRNSIGGRLGKQTC